jgi:hypothetical protein
LWGQNQELSLFLTAFEVLRGLEAPKQQYKQKPSKNSQSDRNWQKRWRGCDVPKDRSPTETPYHSRERNLASPGNKRHFQMVRGNQKFVPQKMIQRRNGVINKRGMM